MRILILTLTLFLVSAEGHQSHYKEGLRPPPYTLGDLPVPWMSSRTKDGVTIVKRFYANWNGVEKTADPDAFANLFCEDGVFNPPGTPPIRGRLAIRQFEVDRLKSGTRPISTILTFRRIVQECGNGYVTEHSANIKGSDGLPFTASGVWVLKLENGVPKIKMAILNTDGPKPTKMEPTKPTFSYLGYTAYPNSYKYQRQYYPDNHNYPSYHQRNYYPNHHNLPSYHQRKHYPDNHNGMYYG